MDHLWIVPCNGAEFPQYAFSFYSSFLGFSTQKGVLYQHTKFFFSIVAKENSKLIHFRTLLKLCYLFESLVYMPTKNDKCLNSIIVPFIISWEHRTHKHFNGLKHTMTVIGWKKEKHQSHHALIWQFSLLYTVYSRHQCICNHIYRVVHIKILTYIVSNACQATWLLVLLPSCQWSYILQTIAAAAAVLTRFSNVSIAIIFTISFSINIHYFMLSSAFKYFVLFDFCRNFLLEGRFSNYS